VTGNPLVDTAMGLREGKPPGNDLIHGTLETTKQSLTGQEAREWDPQTRQTAHKMEQVVTDTQAVLSEKNADEKLQRFLLNARKAEQELSTSGKMRQRSLRGRMKQPDAQQKRQEFQTTSREIIQSLKDLIRTIGSSQEFRSLLLDFIVILQQVSKAEYERAHGIESTSQPSQPSQAPQASQASQASYISQSSSSIPTTTTRGTERVETPFMITRMEPENPLLSPSSRAAINEVIQSSYGTADVSRPHAEYLQPARTTSLRGEPYYPGGSPVSPRPIPPRSATDTGLREQVKAPMESQPSQPS